MPNRTSPGSPGRLAQEDMKVPLSLLRNMFQDSLQAVNAMLSSMWVTFRYPKAALLGVGATTLSRLLQVLLGTSGVDESALSCRYID